MAHKTETCRQIINLFWSTSVYLVGWFFDKNDVFSKIVRQKVKETSLGGTSMFDYTLITNLMHWLLFIRKILLSSTCFEHQVLIFRRA